MKNAWSNLQKVNLHHTTLQEINILHTLAFVFPSYGLEIKENVKSFYIELQCRTLHAQTVITWLKNSRCCMNHFKSILYSLLQVLDITDFCRINRLQMSPEMKCKACKSGKWVDHAIGPSCPSLFQKCILYSNSKKCGAPSCMKSLLIQILPQLWKDYLTGNHWN